MLLLSPTVQHLLFIGHWVILVLVGAFVLRELCPYLDEDSPSWKRAMLMVVLVGGLGYLAFDYTSFIIMLATDGVIVHVPPWYGYHFWMHEPFGIKWAIISKVPFVWLLPFVVGLCVAGFFQTILFDLKVQFRKSTLIFVIQWACTLVALAAITFVVNLTLVILIRQGVIGTHDKSVAAHGQKAKGRPAPPATRPQAPPDQVQGDTPKELEIKDTTEEPEQLWSKFKEKAKTNIDPYLAEVKEAFEPVTKHLPAGVQDWLEDGGWFWTLGVLLILALFWIRRLVRRVNKSIQRMRKRKKKPRKKVSVNLTEDLKSLETSYTEPGDERITVKGMPCRLRLVIMSSAGKGGEELSEEMADWLLDFIKPGLSALVASDYPRVRLWAPTYSTDAFASLVAQNVRIPEPKGTRSPWVVLAGLANVSGQKLNVCLGFYTDEPTTMRLVKVSGERWLDYLGVQKARDVARV